VPPGFQVAGEDKWPRRLMRCTICNAEGVRCTSATRFSSFPADHKHVFDSNPQNQVQIDIEAWSGLTAERQAQIEIACLIGLLDAPLSSGENPAVVGHLNHLIEIARQDPKFSFGKAGCALGRREMTTTLIDQGNRIRDAVLMEYKVEKRASMAIDAATIQGRHFLDLMLLSPVNRPFLYDTAERGSLTQRDYGEIVIDAINSLKERGITVKSITGDNLPVQVSALAHWSKKSRLKEEGGFMAQIKYQPCMCHFTQLCFMGWFKQMPMLTKLDDLLK